MAKQNNRFALITLILSLVVVGCKKEVTYTVSGNLMDPNQKIAVCDATVELWTQRIESGIFVANYILEGTTQTDCNGNFTFALEPLGYTAMKLIFSKSGYFGLEAPLNTEKLKSKHVLDEQYQFLPQASLTFIVRNQDPYDSGDYFEFRILNGYTNCEECCKGDRYQFYGTSVNQSLECYVSGHQEIVIQSSKRKNGKQQFTNITLFVKAFETTPVTFNY